jgi:hypothetical protein
MPNHARPGLRYSSRPVAHWPGSRGGLVLYVLSPSLSLSLSTRPLTLLRVWRLDLDRPVQCTMAAAITEQHPAVESYVRCVQLVRAAILEPRVRKEFDSLQLPPVARPLSLWGTSLFIGWHMRSACYGPILRVARCKGVTHAAGCTLGGYAGCILKEFRTPQFVMMGKGAFAFGQGSWHLTRKGRESQQRWARWEGERNDRRPLSSLSSCSRKPPDTVLGAINGSVRHI